MKESMPGSGERSDEGNNFQTSNGSMEEKGGFESKPATGSSVPALPSAMDDKPCPMEDIDSESEQISPLEWKKKGNVFFGKEDWKEALHAYRCGLAALREQRPSPDDNDKEQSSSVSQTSLTEPNSESSPARASTADPLEVALRSNMAFVLLKLQQYDRAEEECNQLLKISPTNSKGTILTRLTRINSCGMVSIR